MTCRIPTTPTIPARGDRDGAHFRACGRQAERAGQLLHEVATLKEAGQPYQRLLGEVVELLFSVVQTMPGTRESPCIPCRCADAGITTEGDEVTP
jgi:hypothetical protein